MVKSKNEIFLLFSVLIVIFCHGCKKKTSVEIPINHGGIVPVKEWIAIGPFEFDTVKQSPRNTFFNKDLERFKIDEGHFQESDFAVLEKLNIRLFKILCHNKPIKLFDYLMDKNYSNKSNYYLYSTIDSEEDKEVVFIFDGSSSYKVWINGINVLEVFNKENTIKNGDRFVPVKLLKGKNTIFAKVNRGNNKYSWSLLMSMASKIVAQNVYKQNYLADFLNDPIPKDSISIYLGPYSKGRLSVYNITNTSEYIKNYVIDGSNKKYFIKEKGMAAGFYACKLFLDNDSLKEIIYNGDIIKLIKKLKYQATSLKCDKNSMNDVNSAIERLDFLVSKLDESSEAAIRYYHRNLVFYAWSLYNLINYIHLYGNDKQYSGFSIKTYYSKKESTLYHFLIHMDKRILNLSSKPIIFCVPYELSEETMPRSWYIGNLDQMEMDSKMADEYGFVLVWLFSRGKNYSMNGAISDVNEVIQRLKTDYSIDTSQLYLNGECVAGKRALLLAEQCPKLFRGVAVTAPITMSGNNMERPIDDVDALKNTPVIIFHGNDDDEVPIGDSKKFVSEAQKAGVQIKLVELNKGHINISRDERRTAFLFFDSLMRQGRLDNSCR